MQFRATIFMLACWAIAAGGASAQSTASSALASPAPAVRWKFTRGQTLRYQAIQETDTRRVEGELTYPLLDTKRTVDIRWYVEEVDHDGMATITETIERVQESNTDSKGTRELDSKKTRKRTAVLAGLKFSFCMSPHGRTSDVTLPSRLEQAIEAHEPGELSASFGRWMQLQTPSFPLPTDDTCRTQPWSKETEWSLWSFATMRRTRTFEYTDQQVRDGQTIAEFRISSSAQLVDDPGATTKYVLDKFAGKGSLQFDTTAGRILSVTEQSRLEGTMTVGIAATRIRTRAKMTWRLLPGPGEPGYVAVPENK
jgi:hypothetical protein